MRRILRLAGLACLAVVAVLALIASAMERAFGERAVAAIRPLLRTELEVGGAAISIWRDFPYVRVGLEDVRLGGFPEGEFLTAAAVTSRLTWADLLFGDDYIFNTVRLQGAVVHVYRDRAREGNWLVLAPGDSTAPRRAITFELSRILLDDVVIDYIDDATDTRAGFHVDAGELAGRFGSTQYTLTGELAGLSKSLALGELRYLEEVALAAALSLEIDLVANRYTFGPSTLTVDDMPVELAGSFAFVGEGTDYDIEFHTERGQLGALLQALPRQWVTPSIRSMKTEGAFALDGTIRGRYDAKQNPAVRMRGQLRDGSLAIAALGRRATDVSFALSYTNGDEAPGMRNSQLVLANLLAQLDGQPLSGNFAWTDFLDPFYDIDVSGTIPLAWFDELWEDGDFAGELTLRNLNVRGRHRDLATGTQATRVTTRGSFQLDRAAAIYHGERFDVDAVAIDLKGPTLEVRKATVEGHGDRLSGDLAIENLVPYLLGDPSETLRFAGAVSTPSLDLRAWVATVTEGQAATQAKGGTSATADLPLAPGLAADIRLTAGRVTYGEIVAERFAGSCQLADSRLALDGEAFGMEGHWAIDGHVDLKTKMRLAAKLACSEVNITELFERTGNVGQEVVQARHIQGQMTTRAYVEAGWDAAGAFDYDQLHVWANVGLTDGELRDFEMLQALSKFVRAKELAHIRFIDTENWIEVVGEQVYLPAMFIQSTATNFTVAGEHSFAHDIDYSVSLNGAQVLLHKLFGKRQGTDFVPDRRQGWVRTGVSIAGTLVGDDYEVELDGGKVRRHFRHSQRRKSAIRDKLIALFGPESLIDDYDDEGDRRRHLPSDYQEREPAVADAAARTREDSDDARPHSAIGGQTNQAPVAERERRFVIGSTGSPATAAPPVIVDTETYLDFEDEDSEGEPRRESDATPNRRTAATPRAQPTGNIFQGLFNAEEAAGSGQRPTQRPGAPRVTSPNAARRPTTRPSTVQTSGEYLEGFDDPDR